jgi:aromatic-L-amino-acid decarboxylase
VDLSILYTRRPEILRRSMTLAQVPAYLRVDAHDRALNYSDYSLNLGRRFRSLKLWFVLRYYGREGIVRALREHMRLAQLLAGRIKEDERFEVTAPTPFSLVCFRYKGSDEDNRVLFEKINSSGQAFLSSTELKGKYVLRWAIGNMATTEEDVIGTWEMIQGMVPAA